jgi:hypothetical protein
MLLGQDCKCAICNDPFDNVGLIHVDHDHETNKVRALLCSLCNQGLGQFKDSVKRLELATAYLLKHKEN